MFESLGREPLNLAHGVSINTLTRLLIEFSDAGVPNLRVILPVWKCLRVRARDGHIGPRAIGDIGFATLRGGTVIGDHKVILAGPCERIELAHVAEDRSIFARGAVQAALWGKNQKPGLYAMADVLGLVG